MTAKITPLKTVTPLTKDEQKNIKGGSTETIIVGDLTIL